jgi:phosphocarrier protein
VKLASSFEAEIQVTRDGVTVDARSIMGLLMLGAGNGCSIEITAEGSDAQDAIDALGELVARKFDEDS